MNIHEQYLDDLLHELAIESSGEMVLQDGGNLAILPLKRVSFADLVKGLLNSKYVNNYFGTTKGLVVLVKKIPYAPVKGFVDLSITFLLNKLVCVSVESRVVLLRRVVDNQVLSFGGISQAVSSSKEDDYVNSLDTIGV